MELQLQWYDFVRMCTSTICLICMYLSARRYRKIGHTFTPRMIDLWWVMNGFLFVTFEGSIEQILGLRNYGPRVVLVFLVSLVCLRANFRRGGYIKTDTEDKESTDET